MQREANIHFLQACLLLPLTTAQLGLLRRITHAYSMGPNEARALGNEVDEQEVIDLFLVCQEMMDVSPA